MSRVRLSTTSYVVLGMIALRGPSTSYDLKRAIGRSVGYFWNFPHAQLYSEPKRLRQAGLLELHEEESGRRRKTYTITDAGRLAVKEWLGEPVNAHFEMRDVAEIKLFFSEFAGLEDIARLAKGQVTQHERRIAEYEEMKRRYGRISEVAGRMITLELGLSMEYAALEFWRGVCARTDRGDLAGPLSPPASA
ncbi:MAG: PadR family transcriptional regulator [Sciscionella sp.]